MLAMGFLNSFELSLASMAIIVSSWLPTIVAFMIIPSNLYFSNKDGFHRAPVIVYSYLFVFILFMFLSSVAIAFLPAGSSIANVLFFLGAYLLIKDSLVPVKLKDFKNGINRENLLFIPEAHVIEILLAIIAVFMVFIWPITRWKFGAAGIVLLLLIIEIGTLIKNNKAILPHRKRIPVNKHFEKAAAAKSEKGNVYHIVLDSYFGPSLVKYLQDTGARPDAFDGFVMFFNNLANYNHTHPSVASFMTGRFYEGGSFRSFKDNWLNNGLMRAFHQSGFVLWQYVNGGNWLHNDTENWELAGGGKASTNADLISNFADILLLRLVPTFLRRKIYGSAKGYAGLFSRLVVPEFFRKNLYNCLPVTSVELFKQLIVDEEKRCAMGQYVHAHFYFPHGPFIVDAQGNLSDKADYDSHAHCAISLLEEFLNKLKEQGKYHDATILVHSDHAIGFDGGEGPIYSGPIPKSIVNEARALLVIKKPGCSRVPFQISLSSTQLADIPFTICALNDIEMKTEQGRNVFEISTEEHREIPLYLGYHTDKGDFGQAFLKCEFNHLVFSSANGWCVRPNIAAEW